MAENQRATTRIDKQIAERLKARRLESGTTQERLAALCGITHQQVQKYENGKNRVSASRLFEIAGHLGFPVESFYPEKRR